METEATIRLSLFLGLFVLFAAAETLVPRRKRRQGRGSRWLTNWGLVVLDTALLRLMALTLPLLAVGAAVDANAKGWGLFNTVNLPGWLEVLLAVVILDFLIWGQHVITHKIPILWRLHRVHHADRDMDVTTAIRFHPIEISLSMLLKIGAVYALGPSALAVILFEILLNGCAMFNHANLNLPPNLDRLTRLLLVTPDMHRVHHSNLRAEHDSNYGFSLSIWDRVFGTYNDQPQGGHDGMTVGLNWQDDAPARLGWSLMLPFQRK
ncbi:MAG: sterol desaturase family protein [Rhodobacteraceae bacterium]|nr:sterol desaturase family protein [Paracoccaceae bacterium]